MDWSFLPIKVNHTVSTVRILEIRKTIGMFTLHFQPFPLKLKVKVKLTQSQTTVVHSSLSRPVNDWVSGSICQSLRWTGVLRYVGKSCTDVSCSSRLEVQLSWSWSWLVLAVGVGESSLTSQTITKSFTKKSQHHTPTLTISKMWMLCIVWPISISFSSRVGWILVRWIKHILNVFRMIYGAFIIPSFTTHNRNIRRECVCDDTTKWKYIVIKSIHLFHIMSTGWFPTRACIWVWSNRVDFPPFLAWCKLWCVYQQATTLLAELTDYI